MKELVVFSPSRTKTWDSCALRAHLEYDKGLAPIEMDKPMLSRWCGTAIADATNVVHTDLMHLQQQGRLAEWADYAKNQHYKQVLASLLYNSVKSQMDFYQSRGGRVTITEDDLLDVNYDMFNTLSEYMVQCPLLNWKLKGVEYPLENDHCRLDLWGEDHEGFLAIADVKYKRYCKTEYINSTIEDYRHDFQFYQYPWALSRHLDKPVNRMYLIMLIATPRTMIRFVQFHRHPEALAMWEASSEQKWKDMQLEREGKRIPEMSANHSTKYGPCPLQRACLEYYLDEGLMSRSYVKLR